MRYLLDTNVLSELVRTQPNRGVLRRVAQHSGELVLAAPGWQESLFGLRTCKTPARIQRLSVFLSSVQLTMPILPYDQAAADWHAAQRAARKQRDPSWETDAWIAAVAGANGLTLVTRNRKDFDFPGLRVENWFD